MAKKVINSFNAGELSPYLYARSDLSKYSSGCLKMENFLPLPYGGATRRPATKYLDNSHNGKVRLVPFTFSVSENYLLEFGNKYVRVWKDDNPHVQPGGGQIIMETPFGVNDLDDLKFTQSADILFICQKNHEPYEIKRLSDTDWVAQEVEWTFPPMMEENLDPTHYITTSSKNGETTLESNVATFKVVVSPLTVRSPVTVRFPLT